MPIRPGSAGTQGLIPLSALQVGIQGLLLPNATEPDPVPQREFRVVSQSKYRTSVTQDDEDLLALVNGLVEGLWV